MRLRFPQRPDAIREEYRQLIIAYRRRRTIRLGDVATVEQGAETAGLAHGQQRTAIVMNVQRQARC
ncbi:hypothetical protein ACLK19_13900 [Escherichia coli]